MVQNAGYFLIHAPGSRGNALSNQVPGFESSEGSENKMLELQQQDLEKTPLCSKISSSSNWVRVA